MYRGEKYCRTLAMHFSNYIAGSKMHVQGVITCVFSFHYLTGQHCSTSSNFNTEDESRKWKSSIYSPNVWFLAIVCPCYNFLRLYSNIFGDEAWQYLSSQCPPLIWYSWTDNVKGLLTSQWVKYIRMINCLQISAVWIFFLAAMNSGASWFL